MSITYTEEEQKEAAQYESRFDPCNGSGLVRTTLWLVSSPEMGRLISSSALISRQTMQSPSSSNTLTIPRTRNGKEQKRNAAGNAF